MTQVRVDQLQVGDEVRGYGRIEKVTTRPDGCVELSYDDGCGFTGVTVLERHNVVDRLAHEHRFVAVSDDSLLVLTITHLLGRFPLEVWETACRRNGEVIGALPPETPTEVRRAGGLMQRLLEAGREMSEAHRDASPEAREWAKGETQRMLDEMAASEHAVSIVIPEDD